MKKTDLNQTYAKALTRFNFFSRREAAELPKLLLPGETVLGVISGFYNSGTAILCVTSKRLLIIDKKFVRLLIEDVRFESIMEVTYSQQSIMGAVNFVAGRQIQFKSWYRSELRMLSQVVQQKMFEWREKGNAPAAAPIDVQPEQRTVQPYGGGINLEHYLSERSDRWRRAAKFVDTIAISTKAGRRALDLEGAEHP